MNTNFNTDTTMSIEVMQQMLGQTISVVKPMADTMSIMGKKLDEVCSQVGGFILKLNNHDDVLGSLGDRMTEVELNEELTEDQANNIKSIVNKRVAEILHFDDLEMAKYFRTFVVQCYSFLKKHGMGASYRRTHKRYYQPIIDKAESWIPDEGIQKLKDKIDSRASAKRKAMQEGY